MAPKKINKSSISAPTATTVTATAYRFHLPALDISTASLAEGTPIPAPQREPTPPLSPPQTPISTYAPNPLRSHPPSSHSLSRTFSVDTASALRNGSTRVTPPRVNEVQHHNVSGNVKRSYTPSPATSPPSKRPHIRKLLSLRSLASLNRSSLDVSKASTYESSGYSVNIRSESPTPSDSTSSSTFSRLKRRSSGAFWKKNSGFGLSLVKENIDQSMSDVEETRQHTPPPMLPELEIDNSKDQKNMSTGVKRQASGFFGLDASSISRIGLK